MVSSFIFYLATTSSSSKSVNKSSDLTIYTIVMLMMMIIPIQFQLMPLWWSANHDNDMQMRRLRWRPRPYGIIRVEPRQGLRAVPVGPRRRRHCGHCGHRHRHRRCRCRCRCRCPPAMRKSILPDWLAQSADVHGSWNLGGSRKAVLSPTSVPGPSGFS